MPRKKKVEEENIEMVPVTDDSQIMPEVKPQEKKDLKGRSALKDIFLRVGIVGGARSKKQLAHPHTQKVKKNRAKEKARRKAARKNRK